MASRRGYLSQSELAEYADITITNSTEADDQISQAEEMIDSYVGYVQPFIPHDVRYFSTATAGGSNTLTDTSQKSIIRYFNNDYFIGCEIEIVAGTGQGQRRIISSYNKELNQVTVTQNWSTVPDATSGYRIYQLGKFPRQKDMFFDSNTLKYYRQIPEAIKRATAAQVQFMIQMGADFFASERSGLISETIGDYSYTRENGVSSSDRLIAPKARALLRGYKIRTGSLIA